MAVPGFLNLEWQCLILSLEILRPLFLSLSLPTIPTPSDLLSLSVSLFFLLFIHPYFFPTPVSGGHENLRVLFSPADIIWAKIILNPSLSNLSNRSWGSIWRIFSQLTEHTKYKQYTQNYYNLFLHQQLEVVWVFFFLLHFLQLLLLQKQYI